MDWVDIPESAASRVDPPLQVGDRVRGAVSGYEYEVVSPGRYRCLDADQHTVDPVVDAVARREQRVENVDNLTLAELDPQPGDVVILINLGSAGESRYMIDGPMNTGRATTPTVDAYPLRGSSFLFADHRPVAIVRASAETEPTWETIDAGTHVSDLGLEAGDLYRLYARGGNVYELAETPTGRGSVVVRRREDGQERRLSGYCRSYARRRISASPAPPPPLAPKITEVVCEGCGRALGEWSDGSTPRSRLAECCSRRRRPWAPDEDGRYTGRAGSEEE